MALRQTPSESLKQQVGDVPIVTHTRLLGVDITVRQLKERCDMKGVRYPLNSSLDSVDIKAVGSDTRVSGPNRRYLAAWVRRMDDSSTSTQDKNSDL